MQIELVFNNRDPLSFDDDEFEATINPFKIKFNNLNIDEIPELISINISTANSKENEVDDKFYWNVTAKSLSTPYASILKGKETLDLILRINRDLIKNNLKSFKHEILFDDNMTIMKKTNKLSKENQTFKLSLSVPSEIDCFEKNNIIDQTRQLVVIPSSSSDQDNCEYSTKDYEHIQEGSDVILFLDSENLQFDDSGDIRLIDTYDNQSVAEVDYSFTYDSIKFSLTESLDPEKRYKLDNIAFTFIEKSSNSSSRDGKAILNIDIGGNQFYPKRNNIIHYENSNISDEIENFESEISSNINDKANCLFDDGVKSIRLYPSSELNHKDKEKYFSMEFKIKSADNDREIFKKMLDQHKQDFKVYVDRYNNNKTIILDDSEIDDYINELDQQLEKFNKDFIVGNPESRKKVSNKDYHLVMAVLYSMRGYSGKNNNYDKDRSEHLNKSGKGTDLFDDYCITSFTGTNNDCNSCCYPIDSDFLSDISDIYINLKNKQSESGNFKELTYISLEEELYSLRLKYPKKKDLLEKIENIIKSDDSDTYDIDDYKLKYASIHAILSTYFDDFEFIFKDGGLSNKIKANIDYNKDFKKPSQIIKNNWDRYIAYEMKNDFHFSGKVWPSDKKTLRDLNGKRFTYLQYNHKKTDIKFSWIDLINLQPESEPLKLALVSSNIFYDRDYQNRYFVSLYPHQKDQDGDNFSFKFHSGTSYLLLIDDIHSNPGKIKHDNRKLNIVLGMFLASMALGGL